jgi:hypothetical protein
MGRVDAAPAGFQTPSFFESQVDLAQFPEPTSAQGAGSIAPDAAEPAAVVAAGTSAGGAGVPGSGDPGVAAPGAAAPPATPWDASGSGARRVRTVIRSRPMRAAEASPPAGPSAAAQEADVTDGGEVWPTLMAFPPIGYIVSCLASTIGHSVPN